MVDKSEEAELAKLAKEIAADAPARKKREAAELAETVKKWRKDAGITASRAAQVLGVPKRTLEEIEQSKGFRYPQLLMFGILSFKGDK